jgi:glycerophosphoryl diester phosphodiesterase
MTLPIPVPPSFRIIAHRGASAYAPENTAAAFDLALKMGIREVELDTQLSVDGEVVLCHDTTLERYGHGPAIVEQMAWTQLASLDMGSWFSPFLFKGEQMFTLDRLFRQYVDRFIYHVELKGKAEALPEAVHGLIQAHGLAGHCIVTSFSEGALVAMRAIDPTLHLGWLVNEIDDSTLLKAKAMGLFQLCPRADRVDPAAVGWARSVVAEVRAWGVNGSSLEVIKLIRQVVEAGCDGMTINWPDWVRHAPVEK